MKTANIDMRDAFINELYTLTKQDRRIIFLSNDYGAPSLDRFRKDLKNQYINAAVSEQSMVSLATGLALGGKVVYIYGIAPFVTLRCYEQIKIDLCSMNLSVTIFVLFGTFLSLYLCLLCNSTCFIFFPSAL